MVHLLVGLIVYRAHPISAPGLNNICGICCVRTHCEFFFFTGFCGLGSEQNLCFQSRSSRISGLHLVQFVSKANCCHLGPHQIINQHNVTILFLGLNLFRLRFLWKLTFLNWPMYMSYSILLDYNCTSDPIFTCAFMFYWVKFSTLRSIVLVMCR
jgi:hypothetical protein